MFNLANAAMPAAQNTTRPSTMMALRVRPKLRMLLTKVLHLLSHCDRRRRGRSSKHDPSSAHLGRALPVRPSPRRRRCHALTRDRVGELVAEEDRTGGGDLFSQAEAGEDLDPSVLLEAGFHRAPFEPALVGGDPYGHRAVALAHDGFRWRGDR